MNHLLRFLPLLWVAGSLSAAPIEGRFPSLDGGDIVLEELRGAPVLVVNTASMCGFTGQFSGLQTLYETYADKGFQLVAVPSNDFKQEYASGAEVQAFCEVNFNLTFPMADLTKVTGPEAHPFFQTVKAETGFSPRWNFNKILLSPKGEVVGVWGAMTKPMSKGLRRAIEAQLAP